MRKSYLFKNTIEKGKLLLSWYIDPDILLKLGIATLIGMVIGLERELKNKPLGLKTCIVIAVSSCMLTIVSINAAYHFPKYYRIMMDPLRLPAQIISGVGFIAAGVILRKSNDVISGLTTSAMIWGAAGLGLATGAGFYKEAFASLLFILISVEFLPWVVRKISLPTACRKKTSASECHFLIKTK